MHCAAVISVVITHCVYLCRPYSNISFAVHETERDLANVYSFIVPLINNVIGNVSAKLTRSCPTPCKRLPPLQTTLQ